MITDVRKLLLISLCFVASTSFGTNYYVNDSDPSGNIFCTFGIGGAAVSAANDGRSPSKPVYSLKALYVYYTTGAGTPKLTAGDTIFIDKGRYGKGGTDALTTESNIDITVNGLVFMGAGTDITVFDNNNYGLNTDYFMNIHANDITLRYFTVTQYEGGAPNSGTVYNSINTGAQAISIFNAGNILLDGISAFDNGSNGNAAITVGPNSTVTFQSGGSNCNATGGAYSGGVDILGDNTTVNIKSYIIAYNSKTAYNGAGLYVFGSNSTTVVNLSNTLISNNNGDAGGGAGIYINGGTVNISDCVIEKNTITTGGYCPCRVGAGIGIVNGTLKIARSVIDNNTSSSDADFGGIGAYPLSGNVAVTIDSCSFYSNSGAKASGKDFGARISSSHTFALTMRQTTFSSSSPINIGGGSTNSGTGNTTTISDCGNPAITTSGSPACVVTTVNTNAPTYTANPTVPPINGTCGSIILLPVELLYFNGKCGIHNELSWITASEKNNDYFLVERAYDDGVFQPLGRVNGNGSTTGQNTYSFTDSDISSGTAYYRLSQFDYDGSHEVLSTLALKGCNDGSLSSFHCFYNAATNEIKLSGLFDEHAAYTVCLFNSVGQLIEKRSLKTNVASSPLVFPIDRKLSKSIYFMSIESPFEVKTAKLIAY